ncbi:hypothetical protein BH24PSE2_BH24PSE2_03260 [soil metagenome]
MTPGAKRRREMGTLFAGQDTRLQTTMPGSSFTIAEDFTQVPEL